MLNSVLAFGNYGGITASHSCSWAACFSRTEHVSY